MKTLAHGMLLRRQIDAPFQVLPLTAKGGGIIPPEPGAPMVSQGIPLAVPEISGNEWSYVNECLDSTWVSSAGPFVDRFELMLADAVGARHAVAMTSGTAALHVALLVAGVRPDDEVLVSTMTFIAPANAVRYVGAWPVFIDAESDYWQMDPTLVERFLREECTRRNGEVYNGQTGRRVAAILPVHILGHPCNMDRLMPLADEFGLIVIEDATESLGAMHRHRPAGTIGHIGCFSFNGNKIITTGGGGMLVTADGVLAARARHLSTQAKHDPEEYIHKEVGYNYRLTNLQAAVGCAQMERLSAFVEAKRAIAMRYAAALDDLSGITLMAEAPWAFSTYWLYTVLVDHEQFGMSQNALRAVLADANIQSRPLWQPMHKSPAHHGVHRACPMADNLRKRAISLPCSVGLSESDQARVVDVIRGAAHSRRNT